MDKPEVAWITPTSFLDTDIYVIPLLCEYYSIDWYILKKENEKIDYETAIKELSDSINIKLIDVGKRNRSLGGLKKYISFLNRVSRHEYDLVYTAVSNYPYYIPSLALTQKRQNVIVGIHNVTVLKGGVRPQFEKLYNSFAVKTFQTFQTYSQSQYEVLKKIAPQKALYYIPFLPKDYGKASFVRRDNRVTFLNFGHIREYKRIDILIQAAELAYKKTGIKFKVIIAGACADWEKYEALIIHKELFDIRIGRVDNNEIPNLFEESDYFVAPYQDIAQSGALMVAINYEKPILASRLKAFEECVIDGKTGMLFNPSDTEDLAKTLTYVLLHHDEIYCGMRETIRVYRNERFSESIIVNAYREMFDDVIHYHSR